VDPVMIQISGRYRFPVNGYSSHASVLHHFRDVITSLPVICLVRTQNCPTGVFATQCV